MHSLRAECEGRGGAVRGHARTGGWGVHSSTQPSMRTYRSRGGSAAPVQNVAPVNVPQSLLQVAFALAGLPLYPVSQVSSDAPESTLSVQPASVLSQSAPSLSVPTGSLHVLLVAGRSRGRAGEHGSGRAAERLNGSRAGHTPK